MSKAKQGHKERPDGPAASPFNSLLNLHQLFGTTAKAQASGWQQMVWMNQKCLEFLNQRLEQDRELVTDLADMKDPAEAWSVWVEFYQTAQRDYAEETRRLAERYADSAQAATAAIQQQFDEMLAVARNGTLAAASATKAETA